MLIGNPTVYYCPSCNKPMKENNYTSYTVCNSDAFSDGELTGYPHFTPDLAKCPNCGAILFLHNIWAKKEMDLSEASYIDKINDPDRADFIKALEKGLAKNIHEECQIRIALLRDLNDIIRSWRRAFSKDERKLWKENCEALLPLMKESLKEFSLKDNSDLVPAPNQEAEWENCFIIIAELYRNLEKYDECAEHISKLGEDSNWLKEQFIAECKAKNPLVFQLLSKSEMELDKNNKAGYRDYYERGMSYYRKGLMEKSLADFIKAEELGIPEDWWGACELYKHRADIYFKNLKDYDKAINDFSKVIGKSKNNFINVEAFRGRSEAFFEKQMFHEALSDINAAIGTSGMTLEYYAVRRKINEALGDTAAAEWDSFKENLIESMRKHSGKPSGDISLNDTAAKDTALYSSFRKLRDRLYANKDKPIKEVIGREDMIILVCLLAREEDYEQLERFLTEGLPLNETVPIYFKEFQPTPLYYITTHKIWTSMKDPAKMIGWLVSRGADPDMAAEDGSTPLGNHCLLGGNYDTVKALLDAGADPNVDTYQDGHYYKPLMLASFAEGFETNPDLSDEDKAFFRENTTEEEIENINKIAALLREYGAVKEGESTEPEADDKETEKIEPETTDYKTKENEFRIDDEWAEVPDWKFAQDKIITSLIIPDSIISIGKCAFAHCWNLQKIDIGRNVEFIGKYAFRKDNRPEEMAAIKEVINRNVTPQIINKYHFHNSNLKKTALRVPAQSVDLYKIADGWKDFGDITSLDEQDENIADNSGQLADNTLISQLLTVNPQQTAHVWIGAFDSENELEEYADNTEYEWEYYGHLLNEDNFDEMPEEAGIGCDFCRENNLFNEEAADISDDMTWRYFDEELPLQNILSYLHPFPVNLDEALEVCASKYPNLKKANSYIVVFGWSHKTPDFEKTKSGYNCFYLGEFELPEPDADAPNHPWV